MRLYVFRDCSKSPFIHYTLIHYIDVLSMCDSRRYVPTQFGLVYLSNMPRNREFTLSDYQIRERQQDICLLMCNAVTEIQTQAMMVSFLRKNIVLSNAMIRKLKIIHFCSEIGEDLSTSTFSQHTITHPKITTHSKTKQKGTDALQRPLKNFLVSIGKKENAMQRKELADKETKKYEQEKAGFVQRMKKHVKLKAMTRATSVALHLFNLNKRR